MRGFSLGSTDRGEPCSVLSPDEQPLGSSLARDVEQRRCAVDIVHDARDAGEVLLELWRQRRLNQADVPTRIERLEAAVEPRLTAFEHQFLVHVVPLERPGERTWPDVNRHAAA